MYGTNAIVGIYNYIQHPSQCHNIKLDRQINAKNVLKFNLYNQIAQRINYSLLKLPVTLLRNQF